MIQTSIFRRLVQMSCKMAEIRPGPHRNNCHAATCSQDGFIYTKFTCTLKSGDPAARIGAYTAATASFSAAWAARQHRSTVLKARSLRLGAWSRDLKGTLCGAAVAAWRGFELWTFVQGHPVRDSCPIFTTRLSILVHFAEWKSTDCGTRQGWWRWTGRSRGLAKYIV